MSPARSTRRSLLATLPVLALLATACVHRGSTVYSGGGAAGGVDHAGHDMAAMGGAAAVAMPGDPPSADDASARLAASTRHGEWVMIPVAGGTDSVRAWIVYPERATKAPVVVVVHEIFGLSTWIRSVADQLAKDGFIAVAPDFLTGHHLGGSPDNIPVDSAIAAIRVLDQGEVQRRIDAAAQYGMALPAALPRYGIVGFCWGGGISFAHAVHAPALGASVVYYGTSPRGGYENVKAPVLGLYGGNDMRVDATIPVADSGMAANHLRYEHEVYAGAGHGFLRQQTDSTGANLRAARAAWPRTVAWFRANLEH